MSETSNHDLVITRTFNAPACAVFDAWTKPEILKQWWAPKSSGLSLVSCELDTRPGGKYRFEFGKDGAIKMAFFGQYLEAIPNSRLVWTNEESNDGPITTLTFQETAGKTQLTLQERYPTKQALDAAVIGTQSGMAETFAQLDELLPHLVQKPDTAK